MTAEQRWDRCFTNLHIFTKHQQISLHITIHQYRTHTRHKIFIQSIENKGL